MRCTVYTYIMEPLERDEAEFISKYTALTRFEFYIQRRSLCFLYPYQVRRSRDQRNIQPVANVWSSDFHTVDEESAFFHRKTQEFRQKVKEIRSPKAECGWSVRTDSSVPYALPCPSSQRLLRTHLSPRSSVRRTT